jgi:hypothetical protein
MSVFLLCYIGIAILPCTALRASLTYTPDSKNVLELMLSVIFMLLHLCYNMHDERTYATSRCLSVLNRPVTCGAVYPWFNRPNI